MNVEEIARVCHEANRALQIANSEGDVSPSWEAAPDWQRESSIKGVSAAMAGATPAELHSHWANEKRNTGWVYGKHKDAEAKTHPCMIPYTKLPESQRVKDRVFYAIVSALTAKEPLPDVMEGVKEEHPDVPPTVGRIVHFYPRGVNMAPRAAIVVGTAYDGKRVSLTVFEPHGETTNVSAPPYSKEPRQGHWTWPPRA